MELPTTNEASPLVDQKNYEKRFSALIILFIILNTLKITIFNMLMTTPDTLQAYLYKTGLTFLLVVIIYSILLWNGPFKQNRRSPRNFLQRREL